MAAAKFKSNIEKKQVFRWTDEMIENLIDSISEYKSLMSYKGLDFDGDKPAMYKYLRENMAKRYNNDDERWLFGLVDYTPLPSEEMNDEYKSQHKKEAEMISKGRSRIVEKVKDIRQKFSKAVTSGTRSGSGKIVFQFYDKLIKIWGGSANTEPLPFGVRSSDLEAESNEEEENCSLQVENDNVTTADDNCEFYTEESSLTSSTSILSETINNKTNEFISPSRGKRKANTVPKLVDYKRKHLEKTLSASQRDKLLIEESKEDAKFKNDLAEALRLSSESFAQSLEQVSKSMVDVGNGMCKSIEMLARAMIVQPQQPVHPQYMPTQPMPTYYNFNAPTYSQQLQDPNFPPQSQNQNE